ncbi:MAG: RNA polymerase subunit sigma, partial [Bdellovibrionales bacterium]|nr:RNA polymerase subunit sigma [Bdellovibrionales bacterium]
MTRKSKKKQDDTELLESESALVPVESSKNLPAERDVLSTYMSEVAKYPLLTAEEEFALAKQVFEHHDPAAIQKLAQSNLRFVVKIAFEYARYGARILDLVQEGNVGLLRAIRDFNPYKDTRLTTYAV